MCQMMLMRLSEKITLQMLSWVYEIAESLPSSGNIHVYEYVWLLSAFVWFAYKFECLFSLTIFIFVLKIYLYYMVCSVAARSLHVENLLEMSDKAQLSDNDIVALINGLVDRMDDAELKRSVLLTRVWFMVVRTEVFWHYTSQIIIIIVLYNWTSSALVVMMHTPF